MIEGPVIPMEPESHPRPFTSGRYRFQVKWDGVRMVAFVQQSQVRLQSRRLRDRTDQYPELAGLANQVAAREAILDGEIVVWWEGKPSFHRVLARETAAGPGRTQDLARAWPASYMVFDLLYLEGENLMGLPWERRQHLLFSTCREGGGLVLTENFPDGEALYVAVVDQGFEGIVAKERASPYLPGRKSSHWLKVKVRRRQKAVVGGYAERTGRVASLMLGAYRDGELFYIGRASAGLTEREWTALARYLRGMTRTNPPFVNPPARRAGYRWVDPVLPLLVEFSEWTEDLKLRAPVVTGFISDEPENCLL